MYSFSILSPTAILGYGFPVKSFNSGMEKLPDLIGVDAGSIDPGPYYLGSGVSFTDRNSVKRDLEIIIKAAIKAKIPLIIGTAGGSGGKPHLDWNMDIIREIAGKENYSLKVAIINAELDKNKLIDYISNNKVKPIYPAPKLTIDELEKSVRIVGQMGIEPINEALKSNVDIVVAGRAYDPAVFAAPAISSGFKAGLAIHMGKILECASIAAEPGSGSDCILGIIYKDFFDVEPLNPKRKCTVQSVAAHTLYEKSHPYLLPGPGGTLDLSSVKFEQRTGRIVRVKGSRFIHSKKYTIKIEGVKRIGHRTISIAGIRDPIFIKQVDSIIKSVKRIVSNNFKNFTSEFKLQFKIYGRNGVMGCYEPVKNISSHELCIIIEVIAGEQNLANTICSFTRSTMLHYGYPGRISTAGNLAFPYSPSDLETGEVYNFNIYHIVEVDDPVELFSIKIEKIGK